MIWALLYALGVPLWLVIGGLLFALRAQSQAKKAPGVFPCKLRLVSGAHPGLKETWRLFPSYGRWVHDVLIVHSGLSLVLTEALPVVAQVGATSPADPQQVKRLGQHPVVVAVRLDNGAVVELAAGEDRDKLLAAFTRQSNEEPAAASPGAAPA
jgi:hypothetical protein